jgi:UDP-N-acetylmuramoylalanine--D-glutamate ligase
VLLALRERGVAWVSEPEFAARFFRGPLIAVTGTNGKTTVTLLIGDLLGSAGLRNEVGGNVGGGLAPPASELLLDRPPPAWYVLEVSSFQLADIDRFSPDIGVVTSLAPDHLDRYPDVATYWADKARLFDNATPESRWVLSEQPEVQRLAGDAAGTRYLVSARDVGRGAAVAVGDPGSRGPGSRRTGELHAYVRHGVLMLHPDPEGPEEPLLARAELPLLGRHNVANALAAALTARLAGAPPEALAAGLRAARALPHRMEPVADAGGVLWVNDSKATNVGATLGAVESLERPLVLLLGGKDKGESMGDLAAVLPGRARAVICFGAAGPRIGEEMAAAWHDGAAPDAAPEVVHAPNLEGAVEAAAARARPGDVILLSPACSSFDAFTDYAARGRHFAELARGRAA